MALNDSVMLKNHDRLFIDHHTSLKAILDGLRRWRNGEQICSSARPDRSMTENDTLSPKRFRQERGG